MAECLQYTMNGEYSIVEGFFMYRRKIVFVCIVNIVTLLQLSGMELFQSKAVMCQESGLINSIARLNNGHMAVAGFKGCNIYSEQGKLIKNISNGSISNMTVSRDYNKIALISKQEVAMHMLSTNEKKVLLAEDLFCWGTVAFGMKYLFLYNFKGNREMQAYNVINGEWKATYAFGENNKSVWIYGHMMACHPHENEIACIENQHYAYITDLEKKRFRLNIPRAMSIEYSFNGKYLAINERQKGWRFIPYPIEKNNIDWQENDYLDLPLHLSIAFHKNDVLAAILTRYGVVQFVDYKNNKVLKEVKFADKVESDRYVSKLLAFTSDWQKLVVAIKDKFFVYPISLDLIYRGQFKEDFLKTRLLKNILINGIPLPQDIINLITNLVFEEIVF